jgi:uncharacterized damage-inducible protein DinB
MADQKPPRFAASESDTLTSFLDYLRESIIRKLEDVSEDDARRPLVDSGTSLLSLVQHLTGAEVNWFQLRFKDLTETEPEDALEDSQPVDEHIEQYRRSISRASEIIETSPLEQRCLDPDYTDVDLRWVLVHMIEETARHAGHADIIREQIDGTTGR